MLSGIKKLDMSYEYKDDDDDSTTGERLDASSRMTNSPTPGNTRFLSVSVPAAEVPISRMRLFDKALWPLAPHNRNCRSYLSLVAMVGRLSYVSCECNE